MKADEPSDEVIQAVLALHAKIETSKEDGSGGTTYDDLYFVTLRLRPMHLKPSEKPFPMPTGGGRMAPVKLPEFKDVVLRVAKAHKLTDEQLITKLNGSFLAEELDLLQQMYNLVDLDEGGSITKDELGEMMNILKPGMTDQDLLALMRTADTDGGGDIDFVEFCEFYIKSDTDVSLQDGIVKLAAEYERKRKKLDAHRGAFAEKQEVKPAAKLSPVQSMRLRKDKKKQQLVEELEAGKVVAEEQETRRAIVEEEDDSWAMLSSSAGRTLNERATQERIDRERERERRRRDFLLEGGGKERQELMQLQQNRRLHDLEQNARLSTQHRFTVENRVAQTRNDMMMYSQQIKLLRQYLNKGVEHVKLEADREISDVSKTLPRYSEEISTNLDRIDNMLLTVGRALMQESMLRHGPEHKQVLRSFSGDKDFTWLSATGATTKQLSRTTTTGFRLPATHVNFNDLHNLHGELTAPSMNLAIKEMKLYLWATFKHYKSSEDGLTFSDFQKLVADCKLEIAGSLTVLWKNVLSETENCGALGLKRVGDETGRASVRRASASVDNPSWTPDRVDFSQFTNLLLLLACERFIASPSSSPQYKLECFLLNEIVPLLPSEVVGHARETIKEVPGGTWEDDSLEGLSQSSPRRKDQFTIPALLEEHYDVLFPVVGQLQDDIAHFLHGRAVTKKQRAEEFESLRNSQYSADGILASFGIVPARGLSRPLPPVKTTASSRAAVQQLCGGSDEPVLPLCEVVNYLTYRAPVIGRQAFCDALGRALQETTAATYPALAELPPQDVVNSREAVPFALFLALCVRIATYTSVAANVPPPPPPPHEMPPGAHQVYAFVQLLTWSGHYVLHL